MTNLTNEESYQLAELVEQLAEIYKREVDNADAIATGELRNVEADYNLTDERFTVLFYLPDYWKWVEEGRKKGRQPPPEAIERWIEVKRLVPNPSNHKIPNTKQLAYLIGRKIGQEGTQGKHMIQKTREASETATIIQEIKEVLISKIKRELNEVLIG